MNQNDKSKGSEKQEINSMQSLEEPQTIVCRGQFKKEIYILVDKSFGDKMTYLNVLRYKSALAKKILRT
ncbi:unnamed protein product [Paramecium sonneborni]|uniref:Uncharacterized protein n=1 Tax=Paramecium sonneborni TaxID=65129 RepID=A0A8S1QJB4_9CILI|nr:unnamed protein product [Paramecium sonneborni]